MKDLEEEVDVLIEKTYKKQREVITDYYKNLTEEEMMDIYGFSKKDIERGQK